MCTSAAFDRANAPRTNLQPQTVAFLDLLAAHRRKVGNSVVAEQPERHRCVSTTSSNSRLRPSSAPLVAPIHDYQRHPVPWEPLLLSAQQQARVVQRHRPLSAQARAKVLEDAVAPRRPQSAQKDRSEMASLASHSVTSPPVVPRHMYLHPYQDAGQSVPVDFFAHISLRQCPFVDDMFDNPDILDDVVTLFEMVSARCVHRDAMTHCLAQPLAAPLAWVSPWSQVTTKCRIAREALHLQIASPSSKVIGSRVFDDVVAVLNALGRGAIASGLCSDDLLRDIAYHRVISEAVVALPDEQDLVLLHEAPRHIDHENDPLVSQTPLAIITADGPVLSSDNLEDDVESSRMSLPQYGSSHTSPTVHSDRTGAATAATAISPSHSRETSQAISSTAAHSRFAGGFSAATFDGVSSCAELPQTVLVKQHNVVPPWKLRSFRSLRRQREAAGDNPLDAPFTTFTNVDETESSHRGLKSSNEENSPAPRRESISMFKRGSEFGEATAMLRRLSVAKMESQQVDVSSRESSPSIITRPRSMVRFESSPSVERNRSQVLKKPSLVERVPHGSGSRPLVAIMIVVSTFRDASIPNCRGAWEDAQQIAKILRNECRFDYVALLTSESPETPEQTATMAGVRREVQRVIQRFLVDNTNPVIIVIALGRGGVVPVGSISGIVSQSAALVPYPSVAYAAAGHAPRAKQPSPGVKVALLETAVIANGLQSTDVITPEMFQEVFQWNGKICKPAAVFFDMQETPGLPAKYCRDPAALPQGGACCSSTGFCSWTTPEYPPASFVSVYKPGQRAIGSFYFLKLMRGGILRGAAKEFGSHAALNATTWAECESASSPMSPVPLPYYITRHILNRFALYPSDVHFYLVRKLMRRNCNTLFPMDLHVQGMATEDMDLGSPKKSKNLVPRSLSSEASLFLLPQAIDVVPSSALSPIDFLAKLSTTKSFFSKALPEAPVTMQLIVPMPLRHQNHADCSACPDTLFELNAERFRASLHEAFTKVFKGKIAVLAALRQHSWVTGVSVDSDATFTLFLQEGDRSSVVDDCAAIVQVACDTAVASAPLGKNEMFHQFEVEANTATRAVVATAHRKGTQTVALNSEINRLAKCILVDLIREGIPLKELAVSVVVQLTLPSTHLYRKVDKAIRLGVLRQALSNESYVLLAPTSARI
jgi:hypothetical protein